MNYKNMKEVIKRIRASESFDQSQFFHDCGTPACVAGHAITLDRTLEYHPSLSDDVVGIIVKKPKGTIRFVIPEAMRILGLGDYPYNFFSTYAFDTYTDNNFVADTLENLMLSEIEFQKGE